MKPGAIARSVTRGTFFLAVEKVVALVSTLVYIALLSRWLGPTKYGVFSAAFAVVGLATVLTGNFEAFLERYAAEYQAQGRLALLARAQRLALALKLGLGLFASLLLWAVTPQVVEHFRMPELATLLPLLSLFVATDGLATTGRAVLYGLQRFEWVSGLSLFFNVGKTLLVGSLWGLRYGLKELALGLSILTAIQAVIVCAAAFWALRAARRADPGDPASETEQAHAPLFQPMVRYCLPLFGARASFMSGQNLGLVILGRVLEPSALGYFKFAFQMVERFVELAHTIPTSLLPSLTQLVAREEHERLRYVFDQAFRLVQLVAVVLSFVLFAYARELTLWLGSPLFEPAVPVLRVIALVPIVRTAQQPLTMLFQALRRPGLVLTLAVVKLLTEIGGYFLLLPALGVMGAAWANVGGAAASYGGALALMFIALPLGATARLGDAARGILLIVPNLLLVLAADHLFGPVHSLPARLFLLIPGVFGVFALGFITRFDLDKVSTLPLRSGVLSRLRDQVVRSASALARLFEPRRAA